MTIDFDHITRKQAQHIVSLLDANFRAEIMARLGESLTPYDYSSYHEDAIAALDEIRKYVFGSSDMVECGLEWNLLKPYTKKKRRKKKKKKRKRK